LACGRDGAVGAPPQADQSDRGQATDGVDQQNGQAGCERAGVWLSRDRTLAAKTRGYQAVLLDNNQIFFGKIADLGSDYPVLTDVFYIQTTINQETKQQSNILLKRGKEWHAPDKMILNARHIIMIEPVTAGSKVANLIAQANMK
jgi:hypothetical protein